MAEQQIHPGLRLSWSSADERLLCRFHRWPCSPLRPRLPQTRHLLAVLRRRDTLRHRALHHHTTDVPSRAHKRPQSTTGRHRIQKTLPPLPNDNPPPKTHSHLLHRHVPTRTSPPGSSTSRTSSCIRWLRRRQFKAPRSTRWFDERCGYGSHSIDGVGIDALRHGIRCCEGLANDDQGVVGAEYREE